MAATEDRINASVSYPLAGGIEHEHPLADSEDIYENTLVQLNGSDEFISLSHTAGEDDSGVIPFAAINAADEDLIHTTNLHYDRGGTDLQTSAYSGLILELEIDEADTTGYSLFQTAYAVDDETVANAQADGSAGSYAPVGPVYQINEDLDTVEVLVQGILNE